MPPLTASLLRQGAITWKPGYPIAVLNGDGTDRLRPYVDINGSTQNPTAAPTPSGLLQSTTQMPILITSITISGGAAASNLALPTFLQLKR